MTGLNAADELRGQAPDGVLVDVLFLKSMVLDQVVEVAAFAELKGGATQDVSLALISATPPDCLHVPPCRSRTYRPRTPF